MAYLHSTTIYPSLGRARDVQAQLTKWGQQLQAQGRRLLLLRQAIGPESGTLRVVALYESLTDMERTMQQNQADAEFQANLARLAPLLRQPSTSMLGEVVVPMNPREGSMGGYLWSGDSLIQVGKLGEARTFGAELVRGWQGQGQQVTLTQVVTGGLGATLRASFRFATLADMEQRWQAQADDADFQSGMARWSQLLRHPIITSLSAIVLPMNL